MTGIILMLIILSAVPFLIIKDYNANKKQKEEDAIWLESEMLKEKTKLMVYTDNDYFYSNVINPCIHKYFGKLTSRKRAELIASLLGVSEGFETGSMFIPYHKICRVDIVDSEYKK